LLDFEIVDWLLYWMLDDETKTFTFWSLVLIKKSLVSLGVVATIVAVQLPASATVYGNPFIAIFNNQVYKVVERLNTFGGNQTAYCQSRYGSVAVASWSLPVPLYWCWVPLDSKPGA
jgi:hypothetical protein